MNVSRRLVRAFATAAFVALAAPVVGVISPSTVAISAETDGPLRVAGSLPDPKGPPKDQQRQGSIVGLDTARRRLFYMYTDVALINHLVTYDMRERIPRQIATGVLGPEGDFPVANTYTVAYDSKRQQLAFTTPAVEVSGQTVPAGTASVAVFSDISHKIVGHWNIGAKVPGFYPLGVTYSASDDRIYAVGEFTSQRYIADGTVVGGGKFVGPGSSVVALSPVDGSPLWVRPIPECQQVLYSKNIGSLVARSRAHEALYFACVSGGSPSGQTYPGQTGLVRLHIDPKGDAASQASREIEFFAISGSYYSGGQGSGITAFDQTTDRFYLQSISFKTPGAWVFDGRLTAWVGFVSAPSNANYYIGMNEGLGHLYIGTKRGGTTEPTNGLLVADVRQTPVPAGEFQPVIPTALIVTDPKSNRLFVRPVASNAPYLVVEDTTPITHGERVTDYDADTSDTPDTPSAEVFYGLGATGFGAESVQVGGTGSPLTALGPGAPGIPGVAPGTRAVMSARVGALDLRAGGAAASAQAALADINTIQEYEGEGQVWPYPSDACLDAGGRPVTKSFRDGGSTAPANGGRFDIVCDLGKNKVTATAVMGASGSGGTTVNRSSYEAAATRNTKDGAVVTTSAAAEGTTFDVLGGYSVRLGRVVATSMSVAHGRPGTTHAKWTRSVEAVRVVDPTGALSFSAPGCASTIEVGPTPGKKTVTDTCAQLGAAVNKVLPTRFRIDFPLPNVSATPKGAFAAVEQSDGQYFQQSVVNDQGVIYRGDSVGLRPAPAVITEAYNDTTERSRTVTVLAATQSNAIFTVVPAFKYGGDGGGDGGGSGGTGGGGGSNGTNGTASIVPGTTTRTGNDRVDGDDPSTAPGGTEAAGGTQLRGFLFMRRSLRDATLLVLLSGLMLGGCGTFWRRRRLVDVLVTVPRKEAL